MVFPPNVRLSGSTRELWAMRFILVAAALCAPTGQAFYLPGVAPHNFKRGETVDLKVNKLTSSRTQVSVRAGLLYSSM